MRCKFSQILCKDSSCLAKFYVSLCSFDCRLHALNPFVNSNIKRVFNENCALKQYIMI